MEIDSYQETVDTSNAPKFVNAVYQGRASIADSTGYSSEPMFNLPGRAWRDERWNKANEIDEEEQERWFFLPAGKARIDANIFLTYFGNLQFTK